MAPFESLGQSFGTGPNIEYVPGVMTPEQSKTHESAEELLASINSVGNFSQLKDHSSIITELPNEELVVRREDPERLLDLLRDGEPIPLSFVGGSPYANSVEWNPKIDGARGLDNAFLEGFSHKDNVVTVYGFEKPADFFFERLDDSQRVFAGVDRTRVRAAAGFVPLEYVRFITVRIPIAAMEESELTEDEKDQLYDFQHADPQKRKPVFVYRTYVRSDGEIKN